MISQSSKTQHRKKIKAECDDANHDDLKAAVCRDFWKDAPEDILLEIFIRLPDFRHVLRCGIVCHSWHSLISQHPQLIPRFISHHKQHQDRYWPLPSTIIFRKDDKIGFEGVQYFQPICKLFSEESVLCARTNLLDFLPSPMVIRGSCNDLLLASPGPRWSTDFYICNPITKQFVQLPEIPRPHDWNTEVVGHALVCMPGPTVRFKVVIFQHPESLEDHITVQPIKVFCSESRKWERASFHYPQARKAYAVNYLHVVACNGILYWLEYTTLAERVISLDLSNCQIGVIDIPGSCYRDCRSARLKIGVVRVHGGDLEELRLLQVVCKTMEWVVDLEIWKLNNKTCINKDSWVLVHDKKKLKRPKKEGEGKQFLSSFFHPTKGDLIFMVWDQKVFQHSLEENASATCEMIDELQEPLVSHVTEFGQTINDRLLSFPVVHSNWPTPLPNLAA